MKYIYSYQTDIGKISIIENGTKITNMYFDNEDVPSDVEVNETPLLKEAGQQLIEYFEGRRKEFDLPLELVGTQFQKKVWKALRDIPYGETRSYGEIALVVGSPKAFRAVGMANNKNHIPIIIPCHRVIGSNGKLVGYAGGLNVKETLLNMEKRNVRG